MSLQPCHRAVLYLGQERFHYRAGQLGVPAKDIIETLKRGRKDNLAYLTKKIHHMQKKFASQDRNDPLAPSMSK